MPIEELFMKRCLYLAQKAKGYTSPNPMVGSVIVHHGKIIGEGYHKEYGNHHAEIEAINRVRDKSLLSESTMYVNMEPCSIHGNTPPCCEAIVKYKIPKVVIGHTDADKRVNGNGIDYLKQHGVDVQVNVLTNACKKLNHAFYKYHATQKPWVILKWAQSADGFMGNHNESVKISNAISDRLVHKWRAKCDAILVGTKTAITDNPNLTVRLVPGKNPIRLLIDRKLKVNDKSDLFNSDSKTVIFNETKTRQIDQLYYVQIDFNKPVIEQVLNHCYHLKIQSLLVEGGAVTLNHFLDENLWDEIRVIQSVNKLYGVIEAPKLNMLASDSFYMDSDHISIYTRH